MQNEWSELRGAVHSGDWFTVCQLFWQTQHHQQESMRQYILAHMDRHKSHIIIEMFDKVFHRVHFGEIPFERLLDEFFYETTDGRYFSCKPGDVALLMEATDGSLFIFAIDTDQWYQRFDIEQCVDICGNLEDLVGAPILKADVLKSDTHLNIEGEQQKWTFYHFATHKGYVTIRWMDDAEGRAVYYGRDAKMFVFEHSPHEQYEYKIDQQIYK